MKASEISVGNWVEWIGKPCKVDTGLLVTEFPFKVTKSDYVKPIPITEEWLTKNDFEHGYDELCEFNYYIREIDGYYVNIQIECANMGDNYVTCHIDNCDRCTVASADIRYVHQFQNLLNLLDIEMEVNV